MTGLARCCSLYAILFGINKMRPSVSSPYQCSVLSLVLCYGRSCYLISGEFQMLLLLLRFCDWDWVSGSSRMCFMLRLGVRYGHCCVIWHEFLGGAGYCRVPMCVPDVAMSAIYRSLASMFSIVTFNLNLKTTIDVYVLDRKDSFVIV
jgi:hypothetical protein